jgi:uncharacterized protein YqeY
MTLKDQLNQDIKSSLLAGNKAKAEVLKSLKSAILYEEVAQKVREAGLSDQAVQAVLAREAKKRGESADMYKKVGEDERAATEQKEKEIIEEYLPKQLSDEELNVIVEEVISNLGESAQMGQVMGAVKSKVGVSADGGRIAAIVKSKLG